MKTEVIHTGLSNYYGEVTFVKENGKYYMWLENHSGYGQIEITKEFYESAEKFFIKTKK